ncbi:extracellular solute-binding protein [Xylanibacillus composti]|uniref:Carbohydrate ABC transporter, N-acetylglucosamine/diacetylchitobiose-binding protein n=1 Tax=Xylanibacillus composti TaxID=1572762 RepID=A0A8J4M3Y3_9BACL|nr:extracellular solute-binding protein [Xylanibacillus composti]MDT9726342.1 extracellular solute-binding protein [Xylanibacillus composti]GIQ70550.1 carbohydrate ABC transporter, N-acetylglucosamine/diacetylchitobiose-binding protein [Xylanibacillus composti]
MTNNKKLISIFMIMALVMGVIAGCSSSNNNNTGSNQSGNSNTDSGSESQTLRLSLFAGGYGEEVWNKTIDAFKQANPDVVVEVELSPTNSETLRINFLEGSPPDLYFANASHFDSYRLISEGLLTSLEDVLAVDAPVGDGKFGDMLIPSIIDGLRVNDELYLMPFDTLVFGQFYDQHLFDQNGWTAPENLEQFMQVGNEMIANHIAPFTYTGVYPVYFTWSVVPLIGSIGGPEILEKIENNVEGAWKDPAVIEAFERIKDLNDNGFIQKGVLSFDHTQAQMEFINRRAATVVSGTWIENEMEGNWPDDFELRFLGNPWNKPGESQYVSIAASVLGVPKDAKNPELAKEFIKFMFTDEIMQLWADEVGVLRPLENLDNYAAGLPESLLDAIQSLNSPNIATHVQLFTDKYPEVLKALGDGLNALIDGSITIDQLTDNLEAATKITRESE